MEEILPKVSSEYLGQVPSPNWSLEKSLSFSSDYRQSKDPTTATWPIQLAAVDAWHRVKHAVLLL